MPARFAIREAAHAAFRGSSTARRWSRRGRVQRGALLAFGAVPIYAYRCPNGHLFELFKRMNDPPPESCETCGAAPVEQVLYPVAIHYKGSGFYSTDYGRGNRKQAKEGAEAGAPSTDSGGGDSKAGEKVEKKAAAAD